MTDKELIFQFLDANYYLDFHKDYVEIFNKNTNKVDKDNLVRFLDVFGNFKITENKKSVDVYHDWFDYNKYILDKNIKEFLDNSDLSKGSVVIYTKLSNNFKINKHYLMKYTIDYFYFNIFIPK